MHSEMSAKPTRDYHFAEMRKYLYYAGVFGAAPEPPGIRHGRPSMRNPVAATPLDSIPIAATIVACPQRLFHSADSQTAKTTTWISTGHRLRASGLRDNPSRNGSRKSWMTGQTRFPFSSRNLNSSNCISVTSWIGFSALRSDSYRGGLA